jgi:TATA-box binding protein (TBP) (component of TFIID and TFIIIB)
MEGTWTPENRRVVLMNYKTNLIGVTNLSRDTLHANLRRKGFKTNYEPAVYPAVKIYFPNVKWIAKVFRTGNIILTGMTDASECDILMEQLREVFVQTI